MKQKRLHLALAAMFGVSVAVAAHAATLDLGRIFDAGKGLVGAVTPMDEKQEIAIGRDLAGGLLGAASLVNDPALQSYVNKVGRWIASQSERPDLPWRFGVIDTPGINAFATPGGNILITRGLYELLENEAQLAGVLGHEIGHVVKRHHVTVLQKQSAIQGLASGAQAAAGSRGGVGGLVREQVGALLTEVFTKGLDKSAEFEADHLGVVLAARAGYSPYGLIEVLHKLQAKTSDASMSLLFSTHPHPGERLTELGDKMTPRLSTLPEGRQPAIQAISASAPPARSGASAPMPAGARALTSGEQQQQQPEQSSGGLQLPSGVMGGQQPQRGGRGSNPMDGFLRGIR